MQTALENLTIGVFAKAAGVNVETIRFYQRKGLLPEPDKPYGSIRRYGKADVTRVRFVKSAQRLGFRLDEIGELLKLDDGRQHHGRAQTSGRARKDGRSGAYGKCAIRAGARLPCPQGGRILPADCVAASGYTLT